MSASEMIAATLDVTTTRRTVAGRIHTGDDVVARPAHVVRVVVGAHVRDMRDAVAAAEDVVEAARLVEVGGVERQAAGGVRIHRLEEADSCVVVDVAHAGSHAIAAFEQALHHVPADEPGGTRHRHHAAVRNWCHRRSFSRNLSRWRDRGGAARRVAAA